MSAKPAWIFLAVAMAAGGALTNLPGASPAPQTQGRGARAASTSGPSGVYFLSEIMPLIDRLGCNAVQCHGAANGKGGLKLSMFGAYPAEDYAAITRLEAGRRINRVEPLKSLFLLKAGGGLGHKGGQRVEAGSPQYRLLVAWVNQGARWADAKAPRLVSIKVSPEKLSLRKDEERTLAVTAVYSDGSQKDVTGDARWQSSEPAVAAVGADGKVAARDYGQAALVAAYMRHWAVAIVAAPRALAGGFPNVPANNKIDELVFGRLKELGVPPAGLCTDGEFVRRVYLDVTGLLPTAQEARAFLDDSDAAKRTRLIDRLLQRSEFADFWALKWGDLLRIKSEYPINLWPNAVQAYAHWVRDSIARNKPYDQFATELLTSVGSNFRDPPANYFRAVVPRDAQGMAEATAMVFLGARLGCARCHAHPTENWTLEDNLGMAAFFAKVQFKNTQEWKEEIVCVNPEAVLRHPASRAPVSPKFPGGATLDVPRDQDPRPRFAQWLTSADNPYFARNIVNRIWFWLLGRGIVHEVDDLRVTNPPTNPELLTFLEAELVGHHYDLKHIFRLVLNSRTYQLSSRTPEFSAKDAGLFGRYPLKRLGAEQLLDAIGQVTETSEPFSSGIPEPRTVLPEAFRATQLFDGSIGVAFLELSGGPPRDTPYEDDRSEQTSMRQALHLVNSPHVENKIARSPRLARLLKSGATDANVVEEIYLAALSRRPTEEEAQKAAEYIGKDAKTRAQAVGDLVWAILNSKEFLFNH